MSSIFVWIESHYGVAAPTSWEALGAGERLAKHYDATVVACIFGERAGELAAEAAHYGATAALVCEDETLAGFRLDRPPLAGGTWMLASFDMSGCPFGASPLRCGICEAICSRGSLRAGHPFLPVRSWSAMTAKTMMAPMTTIWR